MALSKEVPEFDIDDEVLLMETGIDSDSMSNEKGLLHLPFVPNPNTPLRLKQHKYIDYTRALDATQLYLNEIGFSHCSRRKKKSILRVCRKVAILPGASA
jgi:RNA polymerase nonessential primary-like sigma factor